MSSWRQPGDGEPYSQGQIFYRADTTISVNGVPIAVSDFRVFYTQHLPATPANRVVGDILVRGTVSERQLPRPSGPVQVRIEFPDGTPPYECTGTVRTYEGTDDSKLIVVLLNPPDRQRLATISGALA